ncbi:MAG TPA: SMC-Scp complex subunit ScpB [Chloroflexia bacterium]|nr:SMC-Scp complex subunit ScpB [Chloroflexia bacterium]
MTLEKDSKNNMGAHAVARQMAALEALLFVAGDAVNLSDLQKVLEVEQGWLEELILALNADYEAQGRGLRISLHNEQAQLVTAPEVAPYVEKFLGVQSANKLSAAALETLIIIAYRQPITRASVEAVRGVDSSGVINTLQARGLIEEVGRAESVGHPVLFGTTIEFLQQFGLKSLKELPPLEGLSLPESPAQATT